MAGRLLVAEPLHQLMRKANMFGLHTNILPIAHVLTLLINNFDTLFRAECFI